MGWGEYVPGLHWRFDNGAGLKVHRGRHLLGQTTGGILSYPSLPSELPTFNVRFGQLNHATYATIGYLGKGRKDYIAGANAPNDDILLSS